MHKKLITAGIFFIIMTLFLNGCDANTQNQETTFTDAEIRAELKNLEKINTYPDNKTINQKEYPKTLGTYEKNGLKLVETYFCSDVCPDYGRIVLVFENIDSKEKCAAAGGKDLIDPAWRGYIGCAPNVE